MGEHEAYGTLAEIYEICQKIQGRYYRNIVERERETRENVSREAWDSRGVRLRSKDSSHGQLNGHLMHIHIICHTVPRSGKRRKREQFE